MNFKVACGVLLLGLLSLSVGNSAVVYNSLGASSSSDGAIWGGAWFGDAITLSGTSAVLDGLKFRAAPFSTGTLYFTAAFYSLEAGVDGIFQTGDDTIGSLLGISNPQGTSFPNFMGTQDVNLTGFSISVPKNFVWAVYNHTSDILVGIVQASDYANVTGGTSAITTGLWDQNGNLTATGNQLQFLGTTGEHPYGFDWAVELSGVVSGVPEPSALSLLALGAGVLAVIRRRKRE